MAPVRISQQLRDIANKIDRLVTQYGEYDDKVLDYIINNDDFETSFCELWETIPTQWRSRLKMNQNRLYSQLRRTQVKTLEESVENEILSWALQPEKFYECGSSPVGARARPNSKPFDAMISLLTYLKRQKFVDVIRRRLSLLFIAETVDGQFAEISDMETLVDLLVQHSFVSDESRGDAVGNLNIWLSAGRKYKVLADALGGRGALVFLPDYACTMYEEHFHPTGEDGQGVINILRKMVLEAAALKRKYNLNAHDIVDIIYIHKFKVFQVAFVNLSPHSQEGAEGRSTKKVRRRRRKARYDNVGSAGLASAPPTMTEQVIVWRLEASDSMLDDATNQGAGVVAQNQIPPAGTTCGNTKRKIGEEPRENSPPSAVHHHHHHWPPSENPIPVSNRHPAHFGTSLWNGRLAEGNLSLASFQRDPRHEFLPGQIIDNQTERQPTHESFIQPNISVNSFQRDTCVLFPGTDTTQGEEQNCHARPPDIPPILPQGSGCNITTAQAGTHQHFGSSVSPSHRVEQGPITFVQTAVPCQQPAEFVHGSWQSKGRDDAIRQDFQDRRQPIITTSDDPAHSEQELMMNNLDLDWNPNPPTMVDVGSLQGLEYLSENLDHGWVQPEAR